MAKITGVTPKVDTQIKSVSDANKIKADDINEIVQVVNQNDNEALKAGSYTGTADDIIGLINNIAVGGDGVVSQTFTGSVIPLDIERSSYQTDTYQEFTTYNLSASQVLGANAKIWINTTTEPTITGAVQTGGVDWVAGTDLDLFVEVEQGRVIYFYAER